MSAPRRTLAEIHRPPRSSAVHRWARPVQVTLVALNLLVAGCIEPVSVVRENASRNWANMRGGLVYELANDAYQKGALQSARAELLRLLENQPDHADGRILLARVYIETNELTQAAKLLEDERFTVRPDSRASYLRGLIAELQSEYGLAAKHYRLAAELRPQQSHYWSAAIESMIAAGDVQGASALMSQAEDLKYRGPHWLALNAEVALAAGNEELAADFYRRGMDWSLAEESSEAKWMAMELSRIYRKQHRYADAANVLQSVLANTPDEKLGPLLESLAMCRLAIGQLNEAASLLDRVEVTSEKSISLRLELARRFADAGKLDEAALQVDKALTIDPAHQDALMLAAFTACQTDRIKHKEAALAKWEAAYPDDPLIDRIRRLAVVPTE